jgi:ubiquinone/menaquinone biosynthesis C-methylase UbiE
MGCGSGATTVAFARSPVLRPTQVVGIDPDRAALAAAALRADAHGLTAEQIAFMHVAAAGRIPFEDHSFGLTVCVRVFELTRTVAEYRRLVRELGRVTRPDGCLLLATPRPLQLRHLAAGVGQALERLAWSTLDGMRPGPRARIGYGL